MAIRWCGDRVERAGLVLPARIDRCDQVLAHGLACPVKYVRLVRRKLGLRNRFYAQLVCEGTPYRKPQHRLGTGIVGLDLGPSSIAIVAEGEAHLAPFCPEVAPNAKALRRLNRQLDRQRRANNPGNYDERGRVKPGKQRWKASKRQRQGQARRREVHRRLAATRKRSHGQLAHRVLALGDTFHLEQLSYRAWQRRYGRSVGLCAPGLFVSTLCRLAASAGGRVVELNATRAKLSQRCQCGGQAKQAARGCAGISAPPAGSAPSVTCTRRIWRALWIQTRPCSRQARPEMPGRVGNPSCRRLTRRPPETNQAAWAATAVLLWRPRASERDAGRRLEGMPAKAKGRETRAKRQRRARARQRRR